MYKWRKAWSLLNLWHIQCLYSRYQHESLVWCYFKWIPYICLLRLMLRYTRCFVHCFTRSWAKNNRYLLIISRKKFELLVKLLPHNFYFWIYSGFVNWNDKSKFHYNVCFPVLQVFPFLVTASTRCCLSCVFEHDFCKNTSDFDAAWHLFGAVV